MSMQTIPFVIIGLFCIHWLAVMLSFWLYRGWYEKYERRWASLPWWSRLLIMDISTVALFRSIDVLTGWYITSSVIIVLAIWTLLLFTRHRKDHTRGANNACWELRTSSPANL